MQRGAANPLGNGEGLTYQKEDIEMTEKTKGEIKLSETSQQDGLGGILTEKISRRSFGKLLGAQTVLASTLPLAGCLGGGGGGDDAPSPGSKTLTRAEFVATISDYFDWPHSSEYVDKFKLPQPTFADVFIGATAYAKQIETALEEGVISNSQGYFYPDSLVTREAAADMYVKAFRIPAAVSNPLTGFTDAGTISAENLASVKAMVAGGYMSGTSATLFSPKGTLTADEAKAIQEKITSTLVAPVQVMPKPGTTAPRRYVSYKTPTDGATIYLSEMTRDGSDPGDPIIDDAHKYDAWVNGVKQYNFAGQNQVRVRAVAMKNGLATSAVREFNWHITRPNTPGIFEAKLVHAGSSTSPKVYMIYNQSEGLQAMAFYIEGSTGGIIFDMLQTSYTGTDGSYEGMKPFVDQIATKNYVAVLGHNHPDHAAQIGSFADNLGSRGQLRDCTAFYATRQDIASLSSSGAAGRAKAAATPIVDGGYIDLGNCKVYTWQAPGHHNGLLTLCIDTTGWIYATDMWGCNRAYSADTTQYSSSMKADLFFSLSQQLLSNYKKSILNGVITEVTNSHQESAVTMKCVDNFIKAYQDVIDYGPAGTRPSIRSAANSRMAWETSRGKLDFWGMWHDRNWIALEIGGKYSTTTLDCMTQPTAAAGYPTNATIDYNGTDGYKKYAVLSNVEIAGGTLVGKDVYWSATPSNGEPNVLANKFDPWTLAYTINVPAATNSITFKPTAMSTKITSMKVNGTAIKQGDSVTVSGAAGTTIKVDIVAQDGVTTASYTFTVAKV